jgi:leucine-rich repeat protein SHOC2
MVLVCICVPVLLMSCDEQGGGMSNMRPVDTTRFYSLADALANPDRVIILDVRNDSATTLPVQITLLPKLQFIYWREGYLTEIPSYIGDLQYMEGISFFENAIERIAPEIGKLKNLTRLELGGNNLTRLPDEVCNLEKLNGLFLRSNNISMLPDSIRKLINLQYLSINNNPISQQEIERIRKALPNLKTFDHD